MADPRFFTKSGAKSLKELAALVSAELSVNADPSMMVDDVAPLDTAGKDHITFFDNARYRQAFENSKAGACVVSKEAAAFAPANMVLLITPSPYKTYALIAQAFYPDSYPSADVSAGAHVHPSAKIEAGCVIEAGAVVGESAVVGDGCWIEANAVIGRGVQMGARCRIGANATISHALIGAHTRIYPGARIGQDGFGFAIDPKGHVKVPQLGRVIIGDHVEIGANTCIDRGAGPDTVIGDGVWIDNLVQIGHNVKIGKGCVLVAQSGVAGSTVMEDFSVLAAQAGVAGHLRVGMGARIGAQSGVMRDVLAGEEQLGTPAMPIREFMKQVATLKRLTKTYKSE